MPIEDIDSILQKYNAEESVISKSLVTCEQKRQLDQNAYNDQASKHVLTYDQAVKRNKDILNEFDIVKGNLRSKAIFSPTELHWDKICLNYRNNPALPVSTWRCHLPVFV